jgi:sugar/nucleoside kinase (ribokinase family)
VPATKTVNNKRINLMFDVLGIGAYSIDYMCVTDGYPREDEKMEVDTVAIQGGGNIATACVAVGRLGGKVGYHGVIGSDDNTRLILEELKREKVNTDNVEIKKGNNPAAFIIINREKSTRTIVYSKKKVPIFGSEDVDTGVLKKAAVLLIDFYFEKASLRAAREAKKIGIPVVLDAERVSPLAEEILKNTTHVVASKNFALKYTGCPEDTDMDTVLETIIQKTVCPYVFITLGHDGVIGYDRANKKKYYRNAFEVDVFDTTGAGDVFHGAFSLFLSRKYSIDDILIYSSACSAIKCRELGGRKGIPTMKEVEGFLKVN